MIKRFGLSLADRRSRANRNGRFMWEKIVPSLADRRSRANRNTRCFYPVYPVYPVSLADRRSRANRNEAKAQVSSMKTSLPGSNPP